jgi:hypothetical protein
MYSADILPYEDAMSWTTPSFVEIKMDAEIGSYQEDWTPERDEPLFVETKQTEVSTAQKPEAR